MKKAYLSIGYSNRKHLQAEVAAIQQVLSEAGIELFVFVDTYQFTAEEEKQMMQQAFADIDACDLLIAEVSEKAIGVGIEIGYAAGRGKSVIYLRNSSSEHSTTAAGSSDTVVLYDAAADLSSKLTVFLKLFSTQRPQS